ncbi:MAG: hypothetical protein KIT33_07270 [Candidatus Kapabacteria bacterium]|nr:hypothetical protein [Ignavibacteriota bacterium]MCW5884755.1 hypothetical protein [Candidatus Kapabacteria bacterium]
MKNTISEQTKKFIRDNFENEPYQLLLNKVHIPDIDIAFAVNEIQCRKKLSHKMSDWADNYDLIMPQPKNIEQSSGFLAAKYKSNLFKYEKSLDLTAGFGVDSYFISSNSKSHICVESDLSLLNILVHNFEALSVQNTQFINIFAEDFLTSNILKFDYVYIDPDRRDKAGERKFSINEWQPDILKIFPELKGITKFLHIKLSPMMDLTAVMKLFPELSKIYVISVNNECKELLIEFDFTALNLSKQIVAVELSDSPFEHIFNFNDKIDIKTEYPKKYIYDSHPAILKSGFSDFYAGKFGLSKIGVNTHIYTSNDLIEGYAGKVYQIIGLTKPDRKEIMKFLPDMKAIVIRKNFPLKVAEIRKKYGITEGEEYTIFAVKLSDNKNKFLVSKRIN